MKNKQEIVEAKEKELLMIQIRGMTRKQRTAMVKAILIVTAQEIQEEMDQKINAGITESK